MTWKVLASTYLHKDNWLTVRKDTCELPNGKVISGYYVLEYPDWVNVLALTEDNKVVLVKQYRHALGQVGIEVPGGVIDEGETPEEACRRELLEETGYEFEQYHYLGKICANPATTTNFTHMFLATGGRKVAEQQLDDTEDVEVLFHSIAEVKAFLLQNTIMQSLHVNCIMYGLIKLGEMRL
ncbi:NUDIX hydrolase [Flavisolibacter tropicus]|uniref:GDP-mannose pyrophosphatase n=1 Tax=Flavisolibacter tropicus TaxID=1492898 RepID=A0A172TS91_9BACT|nr:NUDIX hydrolase [Flavisolibacter tropicus]ANE49866.1 DNA mismatch repair protein MutT [Flavisolibacter tropicus]